MRKFLEEFKAFALRGNVIDMAIGVVVGGAFTAFVLFCIIKAMNKAVELGKKEEAPAEPEEPTTKVCPYCKSEIAIDATRCPHCTSEQ